MDLLMNIDTDHDCVFVNGSCPVTLTPREIMGQKIKIKLLTFRGEWFQDTTYGVPYWQEILGHKVSKSRVDMLFQEAILEEQGVTEIVEFKSSIDNRVYSLTCKIRIYDGSITTVSTGDIGII